MAAADGPAQKVPWVTHEIEVKEGSEWHHDDLDLGGYNLDPVFCQVNWTLSPGARKMRMALDLPKYMYRLRLRVRVQLCNSAGNWAYPTNDVLNLSANQFLDLNLFPKLKHIESLAVFGRVRIRTLFEVEHFSFSLTARQLLRDAEIPVTGRTVVRVDDIKSAAPLGPIVAEVATQTGPEPDPAPDPLRELENLQDKLRQIITQVAALKSRERDSVTCCVCFESEKDCRLQCGHLFCTRCVGGMTACPVCRAVLSEPSTQVFI
jgi:hypothetical protein